jgi:hypothetical protein
MVRGLSWIVWSLGGVLCAQCRWWDEIVGGGLRWNV